jgi:APA family basic amino acid/polyamine antiporter
VVSFAWPLLPALFILVGGYMTVYGFLMQPKVSLAAALTVAAGAVVYHLRVRQA